ncbi:ROK family protein [Deinococcus sp.]|uniref:ROK family protein n=1 Tax=Deinococcus sp. TaxID=47478 RepID=UPI003CC595F6
MNVLALDIGGTHVTAARVEAGTLTPPVRLQVNGHASAEDILDTWARAALLAVGELSVGAVAVSVPGPFDYAGGVALFEHKLYALKGMNLSAELHRRWQSTLLDSLPISYLNDALAFALGEWRLRAEQRLGRLLGLTLGTGLGSGFIVDGRPVTAGEGVPTGGELWQWPLRGGIAEDSISAAGLSRAYHALTATTLDARQIAQRAEAGDTSAQRVYHDFGRDLGTVLRAVADTFRPDLLVFGGQVSRAWSLFEPALSAELGPYAVVQSILLDDANLLGAASLAVSAGGPSPPPLFVHTQVP